LIDIWYDIDVMAWRQWLARLLDRENDTWMTLRELAKETGLSYHALRQAAWADRLEGARKSGKIWLATPEQVERAIARGDMKRGKP